MKKKTKDQEAAEIDRGFVPIVEAFVKDRSVNRESRKGRFRLRRPQGEWQDLCYDVVQGQVRRETFQKAG